MNSYAFYIYIHTHILIYMHIRVHTHVSIHVGSTYVLIHVHSSMYITIHLNKYIFIHILSIYSHTFTHLHADSYTHTAWAGAAANHNDMTHSYVWHDSFICVTWLIHMCDMTHSYVWHHSFNHTHNLSVAQQPTTMTSWIYGCDMTCWYLWHDWFTCLTFHIYTYTRLELSAAANHNDVINL